MQYPEFALADTFFMAFAIYLDNAPCVPDALDVSGVGLTLERVLPLFYHTRLNEVAVLEIDIQKGDLKDDPTWEIIQGEVGAFSIWCCL
jgi:hypothetical protein